MTYKLFGCRRSGSLIVELALSKIGVNYDVTDIDLESEAHRAAAYANVNPQRKVPALVTSQGETLTESVAILLTLDERHPDAGLLPPYASIARAQALRLLLYVATELYPIVEINDYPERFSPTEENIAGVREVARSIWRERWRIVENSIAGDPFVLPWGYCATDMYIAVVSRWAQQDAWRPENIPKVEQLTRAVAAEPTATAAWTRHRPDETPLRFN